jgi:hypothetical protein
LNRALPSRTPDPQRREIKQACTDWFRGRDVPHSSPRRPREPASRIRVVGGSHKPEEEAMGFGRGALLWLLGIPLPIILLLALFWR